MSVMAGLVPAIHAFLWQGLVETRMRGHDDTEI
jgi:hypothetical protein